MFFPQSWPGKKVEYSPVKTSSDGTSSDGDASPIHGEGRHVRSRPWSRALLVFPWLLSGILLSACLYLLAHTTRSSNLCTTHWSDNEFGPARPHIAPLEISFSVGVSFNDKGEMYKPHPGIDQYVGVGPDIDKQWNILTYGRYFLITEDEARETFGQKYRDFYNPRVEGYEIGLDIFHTLHCLNNFRKLIHPEHYPESEDPRAKVHDSHCIDQLRQQVMCAGDTTPVPVKWHAAAQRSYVDSDVKHTCRNFRKLKNFTLERFYRSDARVQDLLIHA